MGNVKIRYYVTRSAWANSETWGYWVPTKPMKAAGFAMVCCGKDGPDAWKVAEACNARWDAHRRGERVEGVTAEPGAPKRHAARLYPPGSLGEAFGRFRKTQTWKTKAERTREDWWRGWDHIGEIFGDIDPKTVSLEDVDAWYAALLDIVGVREAHRAMKIWRALWRVAGTLKTAAGAKYCEREEDPSLGIRRKTPKARDAIWREGEAVRLVKRAWRMGYRGLAAALAVAWDTMLSPVDVRGLTPARFSDDAFGPLFAVDRAKTGKAAIGTISRRTAALLKAYMDGLGVQLHPNTPIFQTRGSGFGPRGGRPRLPAPYSKDLLSKDFRAVREAEFPGDTRTIMDFRRSGAVEATAGEVNQQALAGKMANTIDQNRELQATYQPHNATLVRMADAARKLGRGRMRGDGSRGGGRVE